MSADTKITLDELRMHLADVEERSQALHREYEGRDFTPEAKDEFDGLKSERAKTLEAIREREERESYIRSLAERPENTEGEGRFSFNTKRATRVPDDPTNLVEYRSLSNGMDELRAAYTDGAKRVVDLMRPANPNVNRETAQANVAGLLERCDDENRSLATRAIHTSSPAYKRAIAKFYAHKGQTSGLAPEEQRALSLGAQGGNYPIPIDLDPSVILTSNGVVNPIRDLATVKQTIGNTYEGVISAGVTVAYAAENTESTDNSPTLTQPTWNLERFQAFIPYSQEEAMDWGGLLAEMAVLLQDGKDLMESTQFFSGAGHGSQLPQGLLVGATAVVSTAATATFAVADLYSLEEALAPRWRGSPRAAIVMNKKYANKIRQFDTAGGASLWVQLGNGTPQRLLNYETREWSAYSTASTSGASIVTIGDFSQYYIIDRIGMSISNIPQLFGTVNNYPTGQSGLFAMGRNTAGVTSQLAFKTLKLL